ncbi:hypothetical protein ACFSKN_03160 [Mariniflexile gromovii]|uniref:Sulfatase-like protein n=1 Tax=Mariniflexile gromovii TaxID=362523 RepID=A0ABS4BXX2_9FLAO|nr:hypothetical protein [Mariniflexile gromovii]MBP0905436.1 hypothetical protein [Mariniflexile gromovii]
MNRIISGFISFNIVLIFSFSSFGQKKNVDTKKPPNIIYILVDDLGYDEVSSFNENSKIKTAHIDKLVSEGVMFTVPMQAALYVYLPDMVF